MAIQTLTSKDLKTVTLNGCAGYEITNIETLYNTMLYPEQTISNIIMGEIAEFIYSNEIVATLPGDIESHVMSTINKVLRV